MKIGEVGKLLRERYSLPRGLIFNRYVISCLPDKEETEITISLQKRGRGYDCIDVWLYPLVGFRGRFISEENYSFSDNVEIYVGDRRSCIMMTINFPKYRAKFGTKYQINTPPKEYLVKCIWDLYRSEKVCLLKEEYTPQELRSVRVEIWVGDQLKKCCESPDLWIFPQSVAQDISKENPDNKVILKEYDLNTGKLTETIGYLNGERLDKSEKSGSLADLWYEPEDFFRENS